MDRIRLSFVALVFAMLLPCGASSAAPKAVDIHSDSSDIIPMDVPVATIDTFIAIDYYVDPGTSVMLRWKTTGADTLRIDNGVGDVTALTNNGIGSVFVTVNASAVYTLSASNGGGTVEAALALFTGPPRPNIVLFLVDDMGPMDTSVPFIFDSNGDPVRYTFNDLYVTPHMKTLAANGVRFSNAYAQPTCSPTRTSLMTGLNTTGHAVTSWINTNGVRAGAYAPANYRSHGIENPDEQTLPKWLGTAGYRTIHTGKGHFTDQHDPNTYDEVEDPRFIGFDVNIAGSWQGQPGSYFGTADYAGSSRPSWLMVGLDAYFGTSTYLTEALTIEANKAVTESVNRGQPFFLYMSHYAVHAPFQLDPRATGDYSALGGTDLNFATMIEGMDLSLGEIVAHLKSLGIAEDTLIFFLGDNGSDNRLLNDNTMPDAPYNDYPLRGMKGNRSEGGSRIPMIAAWAQPDASNSFQLATPIVTNSVANDIVACWDLPVTIMEVAEVAIPPGVPTHGFDLRPYLAGTPGTHREQEILIYYPHGRDDNDHFANYREGDWKLTYLWEEERHLLFNLADDPTESRDLSASLPDKVLQMTRGMARQFDEEWGATFGTLWPTYPAEGQGALSTAGLMGSLDIDGDGRIDAEEDPNGNGLLDAGETDPDNTDTDGDRTDDHTEIRLNLDPRNPAEAFRARLLRTTPSTMTLTWPSAPGTLFDIRAHANLEDAVSTWPVAASQVPADAVGSETSQTLPAPDARRFFVIELNE